MNYLKRSTLQGTAKSRQLSESSAREQLYKYASTNLNQRFDIFLSHRKLDANEVLILAEIIRDYGFSIYIDWEVDPELERSRISIDTAIKLKKRMQQSRSLIFVTTENFSESKWMPWELGFMDGRTSRVSILPVIDDLKSEKIFEGQEYLDIYPKISFFSGLFVELEPKLYTNYWTWLNEPEKSTTKRGIYG